MKRWRRIVVGCELAIIALAALALAIALVTVLVACLIAPLRQWLGNLLLP